MVRYLVKKNSALFLSFLVSAIFTPVICQPQGQEKIEKMRQKREQLSNVEQEIQRIQQEEVLKRLHSIEQEQRILEQIQRLDKEIEALRIKESVPEPRKAMQQDELLELEKTVRRLQQQVFEKRLLQGTKKSPRTFDELYNAVHETTPNVYLREKWPSKIVTLDELDACLDNYYEIMSNKLKSAYWVNKKPSEDSFFSKIYQMNRHHNYEPFAEKRIIPPGSRIAIHGDMHGDVISLMTFLKYLKDNAYLDNNFRVIKNNFYLLFLGDYTDRGRYGIECVYTILRLQIANPDNVMLIRGNHEDTSMTATYGFMQELFMKYGDPLAVRQTVEKLGNDPDFMVKVKKEYPDKFKQVFDLIKRVHRIYDLMPVVCYLGVRENAALINYVQCCHGGLEQGYNPHDLLDSEVTQAYELLPVLLKADQIDSIYGLPQKLYQDFHAERPVKGRYYNVGFMWNDFEVSSSGDTSYNQSRGWRFGKQTTAQLLSLQSTPTSRIRGVLRGHQHGSIDDPMMKSIYDTAGRTPNHKGVSKLWQLPGSRLFNSDRLWDHIVATFSVGPDNAPFNPRYSDGSYTLAFHAFGILTVQPRYEDWRLEVIRFNFPEHIVSERWKVTKKK